jgi:two-component system chemotaxis sensor kinase CheA
MKNLLAFLLLPAEITDFERAYLRRVNRIALILFAAHVPAFTLIAWLNHTGALTAALLTSAVLVGPAIAVRKLESPRHASIVLGVASMFFGGLLVHFGQGPVQIEMHFYFFSLLAMCAVFGNPMVVVAAAVTVALHHLVIWLVLPASVFNYTAAWWVVAVHAGFVVLESIATCFIARSFFDNVIGLDRIVQARTADLDARNRDMRLLLDSVQQGFLTIDADGRLAPERSAAVDRWFGPPAAEESWFDWVTRLAPKFGKSSRFAWDDVIDDVMPIALTLHQMPHRLTLGETQLEVHYERIAQPAAEARKTSHRYLVIVTDVTAQVAHDLAQLERTEAMAVFEHLLSDRTGSEAFFEDGSRTLEALTRGGPQDLTVVRRMLHTLKGNCGLFGLDSVAAQCHAIESFIAETGDRPAQARFDALVQRWGRLMLDVERIVACRTHGVEIDADDYEALEVAVARHEAYAALLRRLRDLRNEPVVKRLQHFAAEARRVAGPLGKGELRVTIEDNGVRLDPRRWGAFWSTFIHAVRNAVDHGIETPSARVEASKLPQGHLTLRATQDTQATVIEIVDDGRGIDWAALREKAARAGLPTETRADLERALFADGVSTAAAVTEVSGRGIGMAALAQGVHALGGTLAVHSDAGAGTTLRICVPRRPRESLSPAA